MRRVSVGLPNGEKVEVVIIGKRRTAYAIAETGTVAIGANETEALRKVTERLKLIGIRRYTFDEDGKVSNR